MTWANLYHRITESGLSGKRAMTIINRLQKKHELFSNFDEVPEKEIKNAIKKGWLINEK
jgi:hypothetical protein